MCEINNGMHEREKGFYIHSGSKTKFLGVDKKIQYQIAMLSEHYDMYEIVVEKDNSHTINRALWCLPGGSWGRLYDNAYAEIMRISHEDMGVHFFYIRSFIPDIKFIYFIKRIKEEFPNSRFLLEIPTYPYSKELIFNKTMWPWFFKDIANRKKLARYIDRVVTFSDDDRIFDIDTIKIKNGISVANVLLKGREKWDIQDSPSVVNLIAVAQFHPVHGYERIVRGLKAYYCSDFEHNKTKVIVHMVGDGKEKQRYQRLVRQCGLEKYVIFYGSLAGDRLEEVYNLADIGLGVFGAYKRNIRISSALKIREYLAKGLPVVSGVYEDAFPNSNEFFLKFPNNRSVVDIGAIVKFYKDLKDKYGFNGVKQRIRDYASNNIDISVTMLPVLEYLEKN